MSTLIFYRQQAIQQQQAADAATLENVRERCQRAADAWAELADRSERALAGRATTIAQKELEQGLAEDAERDVAQS